MYEILSVMKMSERKIGSAKAFLRCYMHDDLHALGENGRYMERRPAMLIFPGGGYSFCSNREADPVALKFLSLGYEVFTLFYSCGEDIAISHPEEEGAEAVRYIKSLDSVDPDRLCGIGFSAGAHALGTVACHGRKYGDEINFNAIVMSYPVVTAGEFAHRGSIENVTLGDSSRNGYFSLETQIPSDFPPCFIWSTTDDNTVPIENSLMLYNAVREKGIKVDLHIYSNGIHGLSIANNETGFPNRRVSRWFDDAEAFLEEVLDFDQYSL